jgi:lipopolysaccharide transport system permease protein
MTKLPLDSWSSTSREIPVIVVPAQDSATNESASEKQLEGHQPASDAIDSTDFPRATGQVTVIQPSHRFSGLNLKELIAYRDLFVFLVRRDVKVRYAQSAIGIGWAILQPLFTMVVFTIIFGMLAKVSSDGVPYALFSFAGLVPWMYYSNAVSDGVTSLIVNAPMLGKVYFPRLLMPLAANMARLIDFSVASLVMVVLMLWHGVFPNLGLLMLPWLLMLMVVTAAGTTLWLSTFAIQFRDVKHALGFLVQILMYAAPVVYPAALIPKQFLPIYYLNPMVAVIEGIRSGLFSSREMPWMAIIVGTVSGSAIFLTGILYFNQKQRKFADVA